jgi:hypothetical protein
MGRDNVRERKRQVKRSLKCLPEYEEESEAEVQR